MKKLKKTSEDSLITGVCGGIARSLNINSTLIRIIFFIFIVLTSGLGLILYFVLSIGLSKIKEIEEFKAECQACNKVFYFDYSDELNEKLNKFKELGNLGGGAAFIPKDNNDVEQCPNCGSRAVEIEEVVNEIDV